MCVSIHQLHYGSTDAGIHAGKVLYKKTNNGTVLGKASTNGDSKRVIPGKLFPHSLEEAFPPASRNASCKMVLTPCCFVSTVLALKAIFMSTADAITFTSCMPLSERDPEGTYPDQCQLKNGFLSISRNKKRIQVYILHHA